MTKLKAIFIGSPQLFPRVYSSSAIDRLRQWVDFMEEPLSKEEAALDSRVREIEILLSTWGAPRFDESFLSLTPKLKGIFYAAGSIRNLVTDAFWEKKIPIVSAYYANGLSVAHFTQACIIFGLKNTLPIARHHANHRGGDKGRPPCPGVMSGRVGLISLGVIARQVLSMIQPLGVEVFAYDPFVSGDEAKKLGVKLVDLDTLFQTCEVVSLHAPLLPETEGMIKGKHLAAMPPHSTFINTARGAVVQENEMIEVLQQRTDLQAYLDVTYPEPPAKDSPLYDLANVFLTPHIAGSVGRECYRMGELVVDEVERFCKGESLQWSISREQAARMA
ncbi:MAG: hydroxyacid dehydrogenase [Opitutales bacterium]|nr:hydroxyacid dehydrogenase [Opitutales bacterium]